MKEKLNQVSNISGATSSSAPQLDPAFSYHLSGGGDIYVYLIRTQGAKVALMTYDDVGSEYVYSTLTLISNTGHEADMLLSSAIRHWEVQNNPFIELANDSQAMRRLSKIISQFYESE
jgi:hypothetical protein